MVVEEEVMPLKRKMVSVVGKVFDGKGYIVLLCRRRIVNVLHAPGAASPVTVMDVQLLALQDECADAILQDQTTKKISIFSWVSLI